MNIFTSMLRTLKWFVVQKLLVPMLLVIKVAIWYFFNIELPSNYLAYILSPKAMFELFSLSLSFLLLIVFPLYLFTACDVTFQHPHMVLLSFLTCKLKSDLPCNVHFYL